MQSIENLFRVVDKRRLWRSRQPAGAEKIQEAERALGVSFPPSYRAFLALYGAISVGDRCISGIVDNSPLERGGGSVVFDTLALRKQWHLPEYYVVIQPDDDDFAPYCLDTRSPDGAGEAPVVCFELQTSHVKTIGASFLDWVDNWYVKTVV